MRTTQLCIITKLFWYFQGVSIQLRSNWDSSALQPMNPDSICSSEAFKRQDPPSHLVWAAVKLVKSSVSLVLGPPLNNMVLHAVPSLLPCEDTHSSASWFTVNELHYFLGDATTKTVKGMLSVTPVSHKLCFFAWSAHYTGSISELANGSSLYQNLS